jgi:hypothetical protein
LRDAGQSEQCRWVFDSQRQKILLLFEWLQGQVRQESDRLCEDVIRELAWVSVTKSSESLISASSSVPAAPLDHIQDVREVNMRKRFQGNAAARLITLLLTMLPLLIFFLLPAGSLAAGMWFWLVALLSILLVWSVLGRPEDEGLPMVAGPRQLQLDEQPDRDADEGYGIEVLLENIIGCEILWMAPGELGRFEREAAPAQAGAFDRGGAA